jgi:putative transferase (TIGR04331 family)
MINGLKYCQRCCMPETTEGIEFDETGVCRACNSSEQKMHKVLVTTAITDTWGKCDDSILFIGEWCKKYNSDFLLRNREYKVVDFHWKDRHKIQDDYYNINEMYAKIIIPIVNGLNKYHNINRSVDYWEVIVGPWLLDFIAVFWDRWESLRTAVENNDVSETYIINHSIDSFTPCDYNGALELFQNDFWNHALFADILYSSSPSCIKLNKLECRDISKGVIQARPKENINQLKNKAIILIDSILGKFQKKYKVVFVSSYFDILSLIKISLKLKQIPRLHLEFNKNLDFGKFKKNRKSLVFDFPSNNSFYKAVVKMAASQIPSAYVENYSILLNESLRISTTGKIIFASTAYHTNELFKVWCAEKMEMGVKAIYSDHGGSLRSLMSNYKIVKKFDTVATWIRTKNPQWLQVPPSKLVGMNLDLYKGNDITLIGFERSRYVYRCESGPISSLVLEDYSQKQEFIYNLNLYSKSHLKIRPNPSSHSQWNLKQQYIDKFGSEIISQHGTFREAISHSSIIVCSYPQTTFFESMSSGAPTIILYIKEYWEMQVDFDDIIEELLCAKIIFYDSVKAAEHINAISKSPLIWWNSSTVVNARNNFLNQCGRVDSDWLEKWASFFNNQIQENM